MTTWVNGELGAAVDSADRGLNYGDGLFETMRVCKGAIPLFALHWQRLVRGCERLSIALPATVRDHIQTAADQQRDGIVKLVVTRASARRGYRVTQPLPAHNIITTTSLPSAPDRLTRTGGVHVEIAKTRLALQPQLAGLKHLNRLEQVLAANEPGDVDEFLMCDTQGRLVEGTKTNVFVVRDGQLMTPDLSRAGVAGVMREWIIQRAKRTNRTVRVCDIETSALAQASAIFVCNAVRGIWPVVSVGDRSLSTGPVASELSTALTKLWS